MGVELRCTSKSTDIYGLDRCRQQHISSCEIKEHLILYRRKFCALAHIDGYTTGMEAVFSNTFKG